jgi:hypothetical protein
MRPVSAGKHVLPAWVLFTLAAACGGRPAATAPTPAEEIPPVMSRQDQPDPVATLDPACDNEVADSDARPVTATTLAHYHIEDGHLVYLVFVRGTPGWYGDMANWKVTPGATPVHLRNVDIGGFQYDLRLDPAARSLDLLEKPVDLQKSNVIFADRVGKDVVVRGGELLNLCWSAPPDAVGQVLARSPAAVRFVTASATQPRPTPARRRAPTRRRR